MKSWSKPAPTACSYTISTQLPPYCSLQYQSLPWWAPPGATHSAHLAAVMFLTNKELLEKGSFQRFLRVSIHPNDRKKENAVSSLADVQAINKEFKERMYGGRMGQDLCVDEWLLMDDINSTSTLKRWSAVTYYVTEKKKKKIKSKQHNCKVHCFSS